MEEDSPAYVTYYGPPKKTLFSLSQEYGIPREEIIRLNPEILDVATFRRHGLRLPEKKLDTLQGSSEFVYYEVRPKTD